MVSGAPTGTSSWSVVTATAASMPERIDTPTSRVLFDVIRSLLAATSACVVTVPGSMARAVAPTARCSPAGIAPNSQRAASAVTEQLAPSPLAASSVTPAFSGSVSVNTTSSAALVPADFTTKGMLNGTPPSALIVLPATSAASA
jgi:hypothetical protein